LPDKLTRRRFLAASAAVGFPAIVPSSVFGQEAPSEKITIGFIGVGNNGTNWMKPFLEHEKAKVVAVCDVNREGPGYWNGSVRGREPARRLVDEFYGGKVCGAYEDFRELIARDDIDAVYIGTPDHWHALMAVAAARAGKDIYCQKPLSLTVDEGRRMVQEVGKAGVVWQTGSQQRSDKNFRRACELVRNGRLGKIHTIRCMLPGGAPDYGQTADETEPRPAPKDFNYDMWLGPAPWAPYAPARVGVNFRWNFDYSGGQITDWGAHHMDIAQWALGMESSGPVAVKNAWGRFAEGPIYNTAKEFFYELHYENGVRLLVEDALPTADSPFPSDCMGVVFEGSDGWLTVTRGKIIARPKELEKAEIGEDEIHLYESDDHVANFIDCVVSRKPCVAPVEAAHRSVTLAHLGNIALRLERDLRWDPKAERFIGDAGANDMLSRPYRGSWSLDS